MDKFKNLMIEEFLMDSEYINLNRNLVAMAMNIGNSNFKISLSK